MGQRLGGGGSKSLTQWGCYPAAPAARNLGNCRETGEIVRFVKRTFEWGVVIAVFVCLEYCASPLRSFNYFLHPNSRSINAVLFTLKLITLHLQRAVSTPDGVR